MEPNEHQHPFSSFFTTATTTPTAAVPANGLLPPNSGNSEGSGGPHMVFPHSLAVTTAPVEPPARRKRGRPRKYGTLEQALAAKKAASASSSERREAAAAASSSSPPYSGGSSKKSLVLGTAGHGFTPHVISVSAGEDVAQKIMMFVQQSKREMCILSASGSISIVSLCQPATSGGNITYEGRFEIISLSGSYVRTDIGGRTGGLSVCLSSTDGQIVGGGVGGQLKAAGPVQVIVGTFLLDNKKDVSGGTKGDASASKLPSSVGGMSVSGVGFRSPVESSGRNLIMGNDDNQTIGMNAFMMQPQGMHGTPSRPTDWRSGPDARTNSGYELTGIF